MDTEKELRKWLSRPKLSFIENLDFGMKVWNSIEFVLLSKQEIVVDEFCNNLPKLRNEIEKSTDEHHFTVAWNKINEFLSFRYSAGTVNVAIKAKLVKTLTDEAEKSINESLTSPLILNSLLITLQNPSIQNYFKSNANDYAKFLATNSRYVNALLKSNNISNDQCQEYKQQIDQIIESMRLYIKQTPFLEVFKSAFATEILQILCELVIWSTCRDISFKKTFLSVLQELYFNGNQTKQLKQYLNAPDDQSTNDPAIRAFQCIFNVPMPVFLLVIETMILSHRNDFEVQQKFFHYLLNENDGRLNVVSVHNNGTIKTTKLTGLTIFFLLLKKYDVSLKFDISSTKAHTYLGKRIEQIVNDLHLTYPIDILNLLCATLKLDPLILESSACQIAVKFMLMAKKDENMCTKYEEFIFLVIQMYRKLSRAEKFISQLTKNLHETLSTMKLSKKLKRTFNSSLIEESTPLKKLKKNLNVSVALETSHAEEEVSPAEGEILILLENSIMNECGSLLKFNAQSKRQNNQIWSDIAFAFSPTISSVYTQFISGLVTKPSLVVWKSLNFTLKDYMQQLEETDGKCNENCIFLIEITAVLLSQYFMGSRVAEQSDKLWDSIEINRQETQNILANFGHAILNQEHNSRAMNAFLKLSHSASNFDLVCWYYRPDSMEIRSDNNDDESFKLDVKKCSKSMHAYLSDKEWTTIEQRIMNFGKRECKTNINKIYLQRLKAVQLFDVQTDGDVSKFLLSTAFSEFEQISDILSDQSLAHWFIENLNYKQKRTVCELMLQSSEGIEILNGLGTVNSLEFIEVLVFSVYKKIIEILMSGKNLEILSTIDFEAMFVYEFDEACKKMGHLLELESSEKVNFGNKKHIEKSHDDLSALLSLLSGLPIGFCASMTKSALALLNILVYRCMIDGGDEKLSNITLTIFKGLLHFGDAPNVFLNMNLNTFITLLKDGDEINSIFGMVFERICEYDVAYSNALAELFKLLEIFDKTDEIKQKMLLQIAVFVVGNLSKDKTKKESFDQLCKLLFKIIQNVANIDSTDWFLKTTLAAFVTLIKTTINKAIKSETGHTLKDDKQITKLIILYLKKSIDCANLDSVRLLNTVLENKSILQLDDADFKKIVNKFWLNFKNYCNTAHDDITKKTLNIALNLFFRHTSTDDWIQMLLQMEKEIISSIFNESFKEKAKIFDYMAKCQLNAVKGRIFIGFFKNVSRQINLTIRAKSTCLTGNIVWISSLLDCYTTLTNNIQTPMSVELIDDMLSFMTEINIKKIEAKTFDSKLFAHLLEQMCSLCLGLIQHRSVFIIDRVPHFVNVFQDLLQTICWYKSNRSQHTQLEQAEITMLAEMAHMLEKTNKCFVKHSMEVKRVAPYLLLFVINLMITNDRPTTLYTKIKTHIEYICYDLIAICDHRVEGFILRSCNEAAKAVYENLYCEYKKYFKFKGKV